jgi:hypothetical protein
MDCASWNENDVGQWLEDNDFAEHKTDIYSLILTFLL